MRYPLHWMWNKAIRSHFVKILPKTMFLTYDSRYVFLFFLLQSKTWSPCFAHVGKKNWLPDHRKMSDLLHQDLMHMLQDTSCLLILRHPAEPLCIHDFQNAPTSCQGLS